MQRSAALGKTLGQNPTSVLKQHMHISKIQLHASSHQTYQTLPEWVNQVMPFTERDEPIEFDLSAITPGTIRKILKSRPSNSSPGEDEITYHHLKKLPSAHHFLATLFSKILLQDHAAPESWCQAKIILIPKN